MPAVSSKKAENGKIWRMRLGYKAKPLFSDLPTLCVVDGLA